MAYFKNHNHFTSKTDAMNRAVKYHACLDCRYFQHTKYKNCPECNSPSRQYFMSKTEFERGMMLLTLQAAGTISNLRFQPRYKLEVNGYLIATYIADAEYIQDGKAVVEDSKSSIFIDATSLIKIKLFEALFDVTVYIPQRKTGDWTNASKETRKRKIF